LSTPTDNQIYGLPANQFSPSASTTLLPSQCLVKIDEGQQKIKIVRTNQQSNLRGSCQSIFSLSQHHPIDGQMDESLLPYFKNLQGPLHSAFSKIGGSNAKRDLFAQLFLWALGYSCKEMDI